MKYFLITSQIEHTKGTVLSTGALQCESGMFGSEDINKFLIERAKKKHPAIEYTGNLIILFCMELSKKQYEYYINN